MDRPIVKATRRLKPIASCRPDINAWISRNVYSRNHPSYDIYILIHAPADVRLDMMHRISFDTHVLYDGYTLNQVATAFEL